MLFSIATRALVSTGLCLAITATAAKSEELRAETGSAGSLTTLVVQVMAKALAESDTSIRINSDQTLPRSALKLAAGQIDLAIVPPGAYRALKGGTAPFEENSEQAKALAPNLRSLFAFSAGVYHPIVWADSGIESWSDVAGKRIFMGPPGGVAGQQIEAVLRNGAGLEPETDYDPVKLGWGAAVPSFQDGQLDVLMYPIALGSARVMQLGLQRDIRILGLPAEIAGSDAYLTALDANGMVPGRVPAGLYDGQVNNDATQETAAYTMVLAVNDEMSDDQAYELTKAFWQGLEANRDDIAMLKGVEMAPLVGNPIPMHAGAANYYREQGLDIPDSALAVQ